MPDANDLRMPPDADLRKLVQFSATDGRIWLSGQRMLLVHTASLQTLRRELVSSLGSVNARRLLMRAGYAAGEGDALLARQVRPDASIFEAFAVGPQLHMIEGVVRVTPRAFDLDEQHDSFRGVFQCDHSWEAELHRLDVDIRAREVCWMLVGYASGYTSAFFRRPVLFKEIECVACGGAHCVIEGRFAHEWPDGEELAHDYDPDSMIVRLDRLQTEVEALRTQLQPSDDRGPLLGRSRAFNDTVALLRKAAPTQVTVLLTGETGVGKERFARALHAMGPRAPHPFVAVNCAALPDELLESELFGVERGAYTGALVSRPGKFERANGGTLMLDELGELPLTAQAKLLRVLQLGEVERLGATQSRKVDVRVVAATNTDLDKAVTEGRFRRDLFYRLNVYPIHIPPLRERVDDIELLAVHLLNRYAALHGKHLAGFTDLALNAMRLHAWPGNVRELENLVERGVILAGPGERVDVSLLFPRTPPMDAFMLNAAGGLEPRRNTMTPDVYDKVIATGLSLEAFEDALINEAVARSEGNVAAAARTLGITRPQLSYRLGKIQDRARVSV